MSGIRAQQPGTPPPGGFPVAPARGGSNSFFGNLGFPGLLWMLAGLVLCGAFFLPWLTVSLVCSDPLCGASVSKSLHFPGGSAASPTGFSIASDTFTMNTGGPSGAIHEGFTFLLLWLVFLAGLLLVALPLLMALGKVDARRTRYALLALSLLALVVEVAYWLSVAQALPLTRADVGALLNGLAVSSGRQAAFVFSTGPGAGFWVALLTTLAAVAVSVYALYAPAGRRFDAALFWRNLGLAGQVALVAALALIVVFFLPWFSSPDPTTGPGSGWSEAASGVPMSFIASGSCAVCQVPQVGIFPYLWLIPLAALGLLAIAWLLSRGVLWRRLAAILICVALLLALALEVMYLLEVQSLRSYAEQIVQATGQRLTAAGYGVTWGFWLALAVTGAALLLSGFLLLRRHKSVTGRLMTP